MRYKFFDKPKFHDLNFYNTRAHAPHIDQPNSSLRLHIAKGIISHLIKFKNIKSIIELGCGDAGLLSLLASTFPNCTFTGYDLMTTNIKYALTRCQGLPNIKVSLQDFTKISIPFYDLCIMTEVLEHLIDPDSIVSQIKSKHLFCSSPIGERTPHHNGTHLWGWDKEDFLRLFTASNWHVSYYFVGPPIQYVHCVKL